MLDGEEVDHGEGRGGERRGRSYLDDLYEWFAGMGQDLQTSSLLSMNMVVVRLCGCGEPGRFETMI